MNKLCDEVWCLWSYAKCDIAEIVLVYAKLFHAFLITFMLVMLVPLNGNQLICHEHILNMNFKKMF